MLYNGSEFNSYKGTYGLLLRIIWNKIFSKFLDSPVLINEALLQYYNKTVTDTKLGLKANIDSPVFTGSVQSDAGFVTKSPNNTRYRITISNEGDIIATSL